MTEPVAPATAEPRPALPAPSGASAPGVVRDTWVRILAGVLTAAAAGLLGAVVAWLLLSRELAASTASYLAQTGEDLGIGMGSYSALITYFGMLVAGLGLLAWLMAARPGTTWLRSAFVACGAFVAWVTAAWVTVNSNSLSMDWPGPVAPISCVDQGDVGCAMVRELSVGAFAGPLTIVVVLVGATWFGARFGTGRGPVDTPASVPAAPGDRVPGSAAITVLAANVLVGGATLVGLAGVATLLMLAWAGLGMGSDWYELASAPFLTTVLAALVAWAASGSGRGTGVLVLVAAVLLVRPTDPAVPLGALAILLGVVTVVLASTHRPVAALLRRMSS